MGNLAEADALGALHLGRGPGQVPQPPLSPVQSTLPAEHPDPCHSLKRKAGTCLTLQRPGFPEKQLSELFVEVTAGFRPRKGHPARLSALLK